MPEVPLDNMLIEVGQRAAAACGPTEKTTDQVEAAPSAEPNEPFFDETSGVSLDELSVRTAPEKSEQPASAQVFFYFHRPVLRC